MKPILRTKKGRFTKYALLLGAKEQHTFTYNRTKELYIQTNLKSRQENIMIVSINNLKGNNNE